MEPQLRQLNHGNLIDGQYLLERQLGAGGMGTVWVAQDLRLGRSVAIKFLSGDFTHNEAARQRFEREARMVGKIRSPHVVQVFATGSTPDGVQYVVMELLDGEDLATRLDRTGPCSLVEAGIIIEQVCRALARSHREGLVHRDIKPHNIFLSPEAGGQVFVKLLDFGIAKDVALKATALTVTGAVVGSVYYMSPEQLCDAQSVDHLADLWALGVVTYQMLTGRVPFDGDSLPELLLRIAECRYTPASEVNRGLPSEIDRFLQRAITPDRSQRYASADEFASAFAKIARAHASGLVRKPQMLRSAARPAAVAGGRRAWAWWGVVALTLCAAGGYYYRWRDAQVPRAHTVTSVNSSLSATPVAAAAPAGTAPVEAPAPLSAPAPAPPPIAAEPPGAAPAPAPTPSSSRRPAPAAQAHDAPANSAPAKAKNIHQYGF